MTTSLAVRTAWDTYIWQSTTILALTDRIYPYDVLSDSQFAVDRFYTDADGEGPRVNFFAAVTQREAQVNGIGTIGQLVRVRVLYALQQTDQPESTFNTVVDRLETLDDLVRSGLGRSWNSTVDFCPGGVPGDVKQVTIDGKACWQGQMTYAAEKLVSI